MKKLFGILVLVLALASSAFGTAGSAGPVPGSNYKSFAGVFAQPYVSWAATGMTLTVHPGSMVAIAGTPVTAITAGTLTLVGATEYIYWTSGASLLNTVTLATAQAGSWLYTCATSGGNITGCISVSQILPTTLYAVGSTTGSGLNVLQTGPTLIAPALGAATGTSLALTGAVSGASVTWTPGAAVTAITITGNAASAANPGIYVNDQTRTTDADGAGVYAIVNQSATALTHELIGIRGRANNHVASMSGSIVGGYFQAANYSAATTGARLRGIYVETMAKAVNIATQRAIEANADGTGAITIASELTAGRFQVATDTSSTYSGTSQVLLLQNSEQEGSGKALGSMISMVSESGVAGASVLIDAHSLHPTACPGAATLVALFSFKDTAGVVRYLTVSNAGAILAATTCP